MKKIIYSILIIGFTGFSLFFIMAPKDYLQKEKNFKNSLSQKNNNAKKNSPHHVDPTQTNEIEEDTTIVHREDVLTEDSLSNEDLEHLKIMRESEKYEQSLLDLEQNTNEQDEAQSLEKREKETITQEEAMLYDPEYANVVAELSLIQDEEKSINESMSNNAQFNSDER